MKTKKGILPLRTLVLIAALIVATMFHRTDAQALPMAGMLYGEQIVSTAYHEDALPTFVATSGHVYEFQDVPGSFITYYSQIYEVPKGRKIVAMGKKTNGYSGFRGVVFLLDDGSVFYYERAYGSTASFEGYIGTVGSENWEKVTGDALYALSSSFLRVNRDSTLQTWSIDSAGLGSSHIWDFALDTALYVYAATTNGLFKQHRDSSVWHPVNSLTYSSNLYRVFVDRKDRILVGGNGSGLYQSTNGGTSWSIDTAGIGNDGVSSMADDVFGNQYVVVLDPFTNSSRIFKSTGGTSPWQAIDSSITNSTLSNFFVSSLSGDSLLVAGTSFGVFVSSDEGTTWVQQTNGIRSEHISGIAKTPPGNILLSNALGIYSNTPHDTVWTKSYPTIGFEGGLPLYQDRQGNLYTLDAALGSFGQGVSGVVKSTDGGASWSPDTIGLDSVQGTLYYVDPTGTQHFGSTFYGNSWSSSVWYKSPGGSWTIDTVGFPVQNYSFVSSMVSDDQSYLYVSGSFAGERVLRRPLAGGTWAVDTTGIPSTIHYFSTMAGNRGVVIGVAGSALMVRAASMWNTIPTPPQLAYPKIAAVCVDDSGFVFAAFKDYSNIGLGVYLTRDAGARWTYLGLDSVDVGSLVSFGDSSYALTYDAGAFYLGKNPSVTSVIHTADTPRSFALFQNYPNPFNPTTAISFQLAAVSKVTLKVYDLLGREIATLVNGEMGPGEHQVSFDASRLASGIYFYRLQAGTFTATKKLVLLK